MLDGQCSFSPAYSSANHRQLFQRSPSPTDMENKCKTQYGRTSRPSIRSSSSPFWILEQCRQCDCYVLYRQIRPIVQHIQNPTVVDLHTLHFNVQHCISVTRRHMQPFGISRYLVVETLQLSIWLLLSSVFGVDQYRLASAWPNTHSLISYFSLSETSLGQPLKNVCLVSTMMIARVDYKLGVILIPSLLNCCTVAAILTAGSICRVPRHRC